MRDNIAKYLKQEILGPSAEFDELTGIDKLPDNPLDRFITGILFPQRTQPGKDDLGEEEDPVVFDTGDDSTDGRLNLTGSYRPSAIGFSCHVVYDAPLGILISFTIYNKVGNESTNKDNPNEQKFKYKGIKYKIKKVLSKKDLPSKGKYIEFPIEIDGKKDSLALGLLLHNIPDYKDKITGDIITVTTLNKQVLDKEKPSGSFFKHCFFQVELRITSSKNEGCFLPYPGLKVRDQDSEEKTRRLLFRNYPVFATGHGCSVSWNPIDIGSTNELYTDFTPSYEVKPVIPEIFDDISLDMYKFGVDEKYLYKNIKLLIKKYNSWIEIKYKELSSIDQKYSEAGLEQIRLARECSMRIERGLELIQEDPLVRRAFLWMNQSMLAQQIRYAIETKKIINSYQESDKCDSLPDPADPQTWPDWNPESKQNRKFGKWRPFQIAFILMNLCSIYDPITYKDERQLVDLIWFPTGGGKTEAYLGLTAFTIFINRLIDKRRSGTSVIMRYTLRLLTAQQFQRAASLICACELIRKENSEKLGNEQISLGLWVGGDLTPNKNKQAVKKYESYLENRSKDYPFVVRKCPWCGMEIGKHYENGVTGVVKLNNPDRIVFRCSNKICDFHKTDLPLYVVDEEIYKQTPSLVIGTVDKFAQLAWTTEPKTLFGLGKEPHFPPSLIIQDELHLISGPLGSMVGIYETLINEYCTQKTQEILIKPKIIASTATISRATDQMNALYCCGNENVKIFPVQGLEFGDSFFARKEVDAIGRKYIGIFTPSSPSFVTTQVRVFSCLLQAPLLFSSDPGIIDPYYTLIAYYNSLRELGHARTLTDSDIPERLKYLHRRDLHEKDIKRYLDYDRVIELTSRANSDEITLYLEQLGSKFTGDPWDSKDICLATNMISVGLDIPRLGLLSIAGQPKTTSEYIQASSRIGRSSSGPGLVVTLYNPARARDRSIYEQFQFYHSCFYGLVEPTSVTPFSSPVRDRALPAIITSLVRYHRKQNYPDNPIAGKPDDEIKNDILRILKERVDCISPDESDSLVEETIEFFQHWHNIRPEIYGDYFNKCSVTPLLYNPGSVVSEFIIKHAKPAPTSMRNVDLECKTDKITNY
jgi:hypothetical protein